MTSVRAYELKWGDKVTGLGVFKSISELGASKAYTISSATMATYEDEQFVKIKFTDSGSTWMIPHDAYVSLAPVQAIYFFDDAAAIKAPYPPEHASYEHDASLIITASGRVIKNRYGNIGQIQ